MRRFSYARAWLLVAAVAIAIFVSAIVPTGDSVARPGPAGLLSLDLWLHAGAYLLLELAVLSAVAADSDPPLTLAQTPVVTVAYGVFLEVLQSGLPHRAASVVDVVANSVGVALALALWLCWDRLG